MIHLFPKSSSFLNVILLLCVILLSEQSQGETRKRVVFLGDSVTAGYGLKKEEAYPALVQAMAAKDGYNILAINAGLSGDTTSGGLRRIRVLAKKPIHILIIALGGNDGLRGLPPTSSEKNIKAIVDIVQKQSPETKIMIAGMQMPENMGEEYREAFQKIFPTTAKDKKVHLLPFLLEGVAADKSLNLPDLIHPNAQGQKIMAKHVYQALAPLLK